MRTSAAQTGAIEDTLVLVLKKRQYVPHESVVRPARIVETAGHGLVGEDFVSRWRHGGHGGRSEVRKRHGCRRRSAEAGDANSVMHDIRRQRGGTNTSRCAPAWHAISTESKRVAFGRGRSSTSNRIYLSSVRWSSLRRCVNPLSVAFTAWQSRNKGTDLKRSAEVSARRRRPPAEADDKDRSSTTC